MLRPLKFTPGVVDSPTELTRAGRYLDTSRVRFRNGYPETVGGTQLIDPITNELDGVPRSLFAWVHEGDIARYVAIGTDTGLYIYNFNTIQDITPAGYAVGTEDSRISAGYGTGAYGVQSYGTPRTGLNAAALPATYWTFDTWGKELIACASHDGVLYRWRNDNDATAITVSANAPTNNLATFVTNERHVVAVAAGGDGRKVQWSDREDYDTWTPSATNRAGDYQLQTNGTLVCGYKAIGGALLFTTTDVWLMRPTYDAFVYGFERLADRCGVVGPYNVVRFGESAIWLSTNGFFQYNGSVQEIPCPLWDRINAEIDRNQMSTAFAVHIPTDEEIWFFYRRLGQDNIDRYVVFNYGENSWYPGLWERVSMLKPDFYPYPLAFQRDGTFLEHERGTDDNGEPLNAYLECEIGVADTGDRVMRIASFVPDIDVTGPGLDITLTGKYLPMDSAEYTSGPHTVTPTTDRITTSLTARVLKIRYEHNNLGTAWRIGENRIDALPGGRR